MTQVEYPQAIPMFVDEQRVFIDQNKHYAIVIHKTACNGACTAQDVANFFATDPKMASTHYVVGQDGTVVQCVLEKDGAGGNDPTEPGYDPFWQPFVDAGTNLNLVTLSIEHCDPTSDNSTSLTPAQQEASFALVKYLVQKYQLPLSHIKGHNTIAPQDRARCPGNYPWPALMSYLQEGTTGVPTGWQDIDVNGDMHLVSPNSHYVRGGFRQYVLSHNWDAANWPLEEEQHRNSLEESNPSLGQGVQQVFRWITLEMVERSNRIFEAWTGQELLFLRAARGS